MSPAARSVYFFGIYEFTVAAALIFFPNILLRLLGFHETTEVWVRIIGVLAAGFGILYVMSALKNIREIFPLTVIVRLFAFFAFLMFVLAGLAQPMLVALGTVDLAGSMWTMMALKTEQRNNPVHR